MKLSNNIKGIVGIVFILVLIIGFISVLFQKTPTEKMKDSLREIKVSVDEDVMREVQEGLDKVKGN